MRVPPRHASAGKQQTVSNASRVTVVVLIDCCTLNIIISICFVSFTFQTLDTVNWTFNYRLFKWNKVSGEKIHPHFVVFTTTNAKMRLVNMENFQLMPNYQQQMKVEFFNRDQMMILFTLVQLTWCPYRNLYLPMFCPISNLWFIT